MLQKLILISDTVHCCSTSPRRLSEYSILAPHTLKAPTHQPNSNQQPNCLYPTTLLPLVWPVWQKSCIEHTASMWWQLHSSLYALRLRKTQLAGGTSVVYKKDAGRELYARNSLYFWLKRNLTISDKNSCILNMQRGITKRTQINLSWTDITACLVPVLQNMKTRNDGTDCIEKQRTHSICPLPHTALIRLHTDNQNGHTASIQPIRESNGSDGWQPTFSDFACWIGADNVRAAPKASNTAEHTKQICSRPRPSLPKRFRRPTVGVPALRPLSRKAQPALIGQLSQAREGSAHCVSISTLYSCNITSSQSWQLIWRHSFLNTGL